MIQNYLTNSVSRYASKWLVLSIDVLITSIAFFLAYCIRFNLSFNFDITKLLLQLPAIAFLSLLSFLFVGSYKGVVRHTGVRDVYNIFNAICLGSILTISIVLINKEIKVINDFTIPLSIIIIHSLLSFIGLTASRFIFKSFYASFLMKNYKITKNVLIYGAGESGILTHNALTSNSRSRSRVVGYIDKDNKKAGKQINGVQVFHENELTEEFLTKHNQNGMRMTTVCHTRPSGAMFGLAQATPIRNSAWKELMALPTIADRLLALKDPAIKANLISQSKRSGFQANPSQMPAECCRCGTSICCCSNDCV